MSKDSDYLKDSLFDLIAGINGGVFSVLASQPFDTVTVKLQTFPENYKSGFDCFIKTIQNEGIIKGLYAGTTPALIANVSEYSTLLFAYGFCQKFMVKVAKVESVDDLSSLSNATSGALAAFFSSVALTPTELLKCKLQTTWEMQKKALEEGKTFRKQGAIDITREILKTEGVKGMFRGLLATLGREMPGYFFFFAGYEKTRLLLMKPGEKKEDLGLLRTIIAGGVGGIVFWLAIYPIDFAKSRIQVYKEKGGIRGIIRNEIKRGGILNLYKGLPSTLLRTVPSTMVVFTVFEYTKKILHMYF